MRVACLFSGAGIQMHAFELAGHECVGFEIDPIKCYLSEMLVQGKVVCTDVADISMQTLNTFDAIWASPPCQENSDQNHGTAAKTGHWLKWSLDLVKRLPYHAIWVENVLSTKGDNSWGRHYNAAQFLEIPIQRRRRVIGGNYAAPDVFREYKANYREFADICPPAILASERNGSGFSFNPKTERRKASLWYGRPMTLREMAYHQGFEIPDDLLNSWFHIPHFTRLTKHGKQKPHCRSTWTAVLSQAIGNAVPVYMAKAFADVYTGG